MNKYMTRKEWGLVKGALRRVFSRSDLRKAAIDATCINGYKDPKRPRVTKWSQCPICNEPTPTYLMECDHLEEIIGPTETIYDLDANTLVNRIWCSPTNLQGKCKPCHKQKSMLSSKERRKNQKEKKKNGRR